MKTNAWIYLNALVLTICLWSTMSSAAENKRYLIEGRQVPFVEVDTKSGVTVQVNEGCGPAKKEKKCDAYQGALSASYKGVHGSPGVNPGAVICTDQQHAQYVVGTDSKRNENGFCKYPDGSMISGGSLYRQAVLNDGKQKK